MDTVPFDGEYHEVYGGTDGEWLFVRVTEHDGDEETGELPTHDVEVIRIENVVMNGSIGADEMDDDGTYLAEGASYWPIENTSRENIIAVVNSVGWFHGTDARALPPDEAKYFDERAHALRWDFDWATARGIDAEKLADEKRALIRWYNEPLSARAEALMRYYGGDRVGYGSGQFETLAEAMQEAGIPRYVLSNTAAYDVDPMTEEGWGPECEHCRAEHIYPRERHARIVARQMQEAWMADKHDEAEALGNHLAYRIADVEKHSYGTPEWYIGDHSYTEEYIEPDFPLK